MKRSVFRVTSGAGHGFTRHTWNAAVRAIEAEARKLARKHGTTFYLAGSTSVRSIETGKHYAGSRTWESPGRVVTFTIEQES